MKYTKVIKIWTAPKTKVNLLFIGREVDKDPQLCVSGVASFTKETNKW